MERSGLSAQVGILKKELNALRGSGRRSEGGYPPEIEIEIERLRGKRDREYQRRKRAEAEMDEMEAELNEMKEKVKKMEDELAEIANAPKPVSQIFTTFSHLSKLSFVPLLFYCRSSMLEIRLIRHVLPNCRLLSINFVWIMNLSGLSSLILDHVLRKNLLCWNHFLMM